MAGQIQNISSIFTQIRHTRVQFTELINQLNINQLNKIPVGFRNNIIWNYGHIAVTTPILCYHRSGVNPNLAIPFQQAYQKDSIPSYSVKTEEVQQLKEYIKSSIDQLELDLQKGLFIQTNTFSTSTYHAELRDIQEILLTTLMHDNLHYGYAKALLKLKKEYKKLPYGV